MTKNFKKNDIIIVLNLHIIFEDSEAYKPLIDMDKLSI